MAVGLGKRLLAPPGTGLARDYLVQIDEQDKLRLQSYPAARPPKDACAADTSDA